MYILLIIKVIITIRRCVECSFSLHIHKIFILFVISRLMCWPRFRLFPVMTCKFLDILFPFLSTVTEIGKHDGTFPATTTFRSLVICCLAYHLRSRLNYSYQWSQLFPAGITSSLTCLSLHLNQ